MFNTATFEIQFYLSIRNYDVCLLLNKVVIEQKQLLLQLQSSVPIWHAASLINGTECLRSSLLLRMFSFCLSPLAGTISSWVVIFILPINSALNPILYTLTTRPFKETILQVWANYRQKRPQLNSQPAHHPSLTWQEMWPLQNNSHGLTAGHHPEKTGPVQAKLTPVENTNDGYNDIIVCAQQKKQHMVLSVCSQKQSAAHTVTL